MGKDTHEGQSGGPLHGARDGRPARAGSVAMNRRHIKGLKGQVSPVALGFEFFETLDSASVLLDGYYGAAGNVFDTGFIYGEGKTEKIFGRWQQKNRLSRDDFFLIGKGAHAPDCYPEAVGRQLDISLERLQVDYLDIYFLHRDNLDVPVGEFVDALDAEIKAGRIRGLWGGSNWTMERLDAAIAYAHAGGKTAPGALSNNFSLAEMVNPVWQGCVAASSPAWKSWLKASQMPNFAWSSQGRGFFTEQAGRGKLENGELVAAWYSQENFARRDRAIELAEMIGRSPIHIALAYVLAQPFPVVALIGPRRLSELEDSLSALDIELTPEQVVWLETGMGRP